MRPDWYLLWLRWRVRCETQQLRMARWLRRSVPALPGAACVAWLIAVSAVRLLAG